MGYYTSFNLTWEDRGQEVPADDLRDKVIARMGEDANQILALLPEPATLNGQIAGYIQSNECMNYAMDESGNCNESCKWYHWADDMREMSREFPKVLFTLNGEGEESGDIWKAYFLNGKMQ